MKYEEFLQQKSQYDSSFGFTPTDMNESLYDFQKSLVKWACQRGRGSLFCDCGLGKTIMQLEWAQQIVKHTSKKVLILAPLAVSHQTVREGEKFGISVTHCRERSDVKEGINIINYERLHKIDPEQFIGAVCDESSILKSFDGVRRREITEFMKKMPYRLLATATAAPNDYWELGTSSEALGELGRMDMLSRFFVNDSNTTQERRHARNYNGDGKFRFKGHAELPFWRWVCSWSRAMRRPSDLNFDDDGFILPELIVNEHLVDSKTLAPGMLFALPAVGLQEQRAERRRTLTERCECAASLVANKKDQSIVWCHLNDEGDQLERMISDAIQISGRDSDESKEDKFESFLSGKARVLITKPKIGAWGLNLQQCSHIVYFPSHSYEQYYQAVRRCWRYGQKKSVVVDIVMTEGDSLVMRNLKRKAEAADKMFSALVSEMNDATKIKRGIEYTTKERIPGWLS